MQCTWLTDKAETRRSSDGGFGAFALRTIAAGETVAVFGGTLSSGAEFSRLSADRRSRSIQVEEDLYLVGGEVPEDGDMINHSCAPTCGLRGSSILVAMQAIPPGAALTYEYATSDGGPYDEFVCQCGASSCRGVVTGSDWMRPDIQDRYRDWFSPYLWRRISRFGVGSSTPDHQGDAMRVASTSEWSRRTPTDLSAPEGMMSFPWARRQVT